MSPDGRTLYVAETETARLWAWDLKGPGDLAKPAVASPQSPHGSRLVYASPVYQRFDSLAVEANGDICIGTLDRGGITIVDGNNNYSTQAADISQIPLLPGFVAGQIAVQRDIVPNVATGKVYFRIVNGSSTTIGVLNGTVATPLPASLGPVSK